MKNKFFIILFLGLLLSGCVGVSSKGIFGTGVSIAFDPRSVGTQVDDSIMQKNLSARSLLMDKKYLLSVKIKVLDGRIFLTGKVDNPEEKLKLTKLAWETDGVRSVRNDIKIKEEFNFKQSAKDILIMPSQHSAAISYKMIKSMSRAKVIGPLLVGLGLPIEIAPLRTSTSELINLASIAAYSADVIDYKK